MLAWQIRRIPQFHPGKSRNIQYANEQKYTVCITNIRINPNRKQERHIFKNILALENQFADNQKKPVFKEA